MRGICLLLAPHGVDIGIDIDIGIQGGLGLRHALSRGTCARDSLATRSAQRYWQLSRARAV